MDTSSQGTQGGRSVLSIKNAAEVIKRKGSYQTGTCELRVNINKASYQQQNQGDQMVTSAIIPQVVRGKNVPNGLLRRATDNAQGR